MLSYEEEHAVALLRIISLIKQNKLSQARSLSFPDHSTTNYLYMNPLVDTTSPIMAIVQEDTPFLRQQVKEFGLKEGTDVFFGINTDPIDPNDMISCWADLDLIGMNKLNMT